MVHHRVHNTLPLDPYLSHLATQSIKKKVPPIIERSSERVEFLRWSIQTQQRNEVVKVYGEFGMLQKHIEHNFM